jgi:hypothetical protein
MTQVPQVGQVPPADPMDPPAQPHPMSRHTSQAGRPLELVRDPSEPDRHAREKIAFYCETQGPAPADSGVAVPEKPEPVPVSRARLIDVLQYPLNLDGLVHTLPMAFGLSLLHLLMSGLGPVFRGDVRGTVLLVSLALPWYYVIVSYAVLYFELCILDSTQGETRAPMVATWYWPIRLNPLVQLLLLGGAVILCFVPALIGGALWGMTLRFWALAGLGVFVLPTLVLACTLCDGREAFNPVLIVRSIVATLPAYLGLLGRLTLLLASAGAFHWNASRWGLPRVFFYAGYLYSLWIAGHLLGRFYLRQKDKLGWGV